MRNIVLTCGLLALMLPIPVFAHNNTAYITSRELEIELEDLHKRAKKGRAMQKFQVNDLPSRSSRGKIGMFFFGERILVRAGQQGSYKYDPLNPQAGAKMQRAYKAKYETKFHPSKRLSPRAGMPAPNTPLDAVVDGKYSVTLLDWELLGTNFAANPNFSSVDLRRHYVEFLGDDQFRVLPWTTADVLAFDRGEHASQQQPANPPGNAAGNAAAPAPAPTQNKNMNERMWTDNKVRGEFLDTDGNWVTIKTANGKRRKLDFGTLTDEDVAFIEKKTGKKF